jgi:hypothetical protein
VTNVPWWCREYCQDGLDQGAAGAGQHTQPVRYGDAGAVDGGHGTQPALHRSGGATDAAAATTDDAAAAASNHTRRNCTLLSSHLLPSLSTPPTLFLCLFLWLLSLALSLSLSLAVSFYRRSTALPAVDIVAGVCRGRLLSPPLRRPVRGRAPAGHAMLDHLFPTNHCSLVH